MFVGEDEDEDEDEYDEEDEEYEDEWDEESEETGVQSIQGLKTTYMILEEGSGRRVKRGSQVLVHAQGFLRDSLKHFWHTRDPGQKPFRFSAGGGRVIRGWDEQGCIGMLQGEKRRLWIPSEEAYKSAGFPAWGIPPNSNLIFEIEVLEILQ
ncbi:hypothetical protein GUITHDRAFT_67801 [Guillardia theta CCMP2712]|uniref:peptidylprolyl isomerase n=1 Tax=Guillardia theta (strain CCMP2712) TaxID=905079 RepID=L1JN65_GUITC|nr:hypothetical protein GUITHDRAFT_67801 [Guillardia theta CCMP2712]EKX49719.1 hypothetical protein GUITHDRAFT_67801 [Guillardia theta CCMP2712]|eukprot:XP_005836699.1 hypothetical protein GUITHDRAFT_67801 [Guillardia theta CCMP2712]